MERRRGQKRRSRRPPALLVAAPPELYSRAMEAVILSLEGAAALVILYAAGQALVSFARRVFHHKPISERARRRFARGLLLGLDFTIGSDILKVAIEPTLDAVLVAGLVVIVRTVLTLVLEYELRRAETRDGSEDE